MSAYLVVAILALVAVGVGVYLGLRPAGTPSAGEPVDTTETAAATTDTTTPVRESARALFGHSCGTCHSLRAAGVPPQNAVGPNLDEIRPTRARVREMIATGAGIMPAGILEGDDAERVAAFVARNAGR